MYASDEPRILIHDGRDSILRSMSDVIRIGDLFNDSAKPRFELSGTLWRE